MKVKEIKVENLTHVFENSYFPSVVVLQDVNLTFSSGKIIAIVGPVSSGKTVLLKHLNGLLTPSSGRVVIGDSVIEAGKDRIDRIWDIRKNVGFVFQFAEHQLFEKTVEKDIIFGPLNFGITKTVAKINAIKYLELLGLNAAYLSRSPFELSGGERRKVAIAGVLAYDPEFILFDQLAAGMDLKSKNEFLDFLLNLKTKMKKSVIFTSNNSDDVLKIADQVVVLNKGKVVKVTTPKELFWDFDFCQNSGILLPKTICFLRSLQEAGFQLSPAQLPFSSEKDLIKGLVVFLKKQLSLKGS